MTLPTQESIINIVMDNLITYLNTELITDITDDAVAGLVRGGNLQDDPTRPIISLLVHPGGPDHKDHLNTEGSSAGKYVDNAYEIGGAFGGIFWRRYLRLEVIMFFSNNTDRDEIRRIAMVFNSRLQNKLYTWDIGNQTHADSFGERAYDSQVISSGFLEGGGDGDFNWRGDVIYEYLTEIEPVST